ncbi:MAG: SRPBCC family protein [Bacteroidetes bacterium]|nr:SRPBCC family protein [Bacteroidota bacterium]
MNIKKSLITVEVIVDAPIEMVWENWTNPTAITKWNNASDDWHTTKAENDLRIGGKFLSRMEAKDGTEGFDFIGVYDNVKTNELIEYTLEDDRKVKISFTSQNGKTKVVETFEAESENSLELQFGGWQSILDNFKKYTEAHFINKP